MDKWQKISQMARSGIIYFRCDPPIGDFIPKYSGSFVISSPESQITVESDEVNLSSFVTLLYRTILAKNHTVITWDIKKFISHARYILQRPLTAPGASVIDLKYGLAYLGDRRKKAVESPTEALDLCRGMVEDPGWRAVNKRVHVPLATEVLPALETRGVFDTSVPKILYSSYEIEGQANGRLSTLKVSKDYLTVHSMTPEQRSVLRPPYPEGQKSFFIEMDFVNMEVVMLQWLSQDPDLASALAQPEDFYESLLDLDCDPSEKRQIGKMIFLPVVYGLQSASLAKRLKIDHSTADTLISGLKDRFPTCLAWLDTQEAKLADDSVAKDYLGRRRDFANGPSYKRRNFEVQSPAATVCLEKLCHLYKALPDHVLFHIHDGYVLMCKANEAEYVVRQAFGALESGSEICPGLRLKTKCKFGTRLSDLKTLFRSQ